jgi:hypothetical protein
MLIHRPLLAFVAAMSIAPAVRADPIIQMQQYFQTQIQDNWCWAATSSTIIVYYEDPRIAPRKVRQCGLASRYNVPGVPLDYCCDSSHGSDTNTCNKGNSPAAVLRDFDHLARVIDGQLTDSTFDAMTDEFAANRPPVGIIGWQGTYLSHAIIPYGLGFGGIAGGQAIYIFDPVTGKQVAMQDKDALNGYGAAGNGGWTGTIFTRRP